MRSRYLVLAKERLMHFYYFVNLYNPRILLVILFILARGIVQKATTHFSIAISRPTDLCPGMGQITRSFPFIIIIHLPFVHGAEYIDKSQVSSSVTIKYLQFNIFMLTIIILLFTRLLLG